MKKATIFGKYLLLDRLNVGGMAEVFIAKAFGVEGLERYIAIKRILPSMAEDAEFIQMFIDEARISVQLNHANVVHIHELDKVDESYYIAMEYVAGKDVRTLLERYRRRQEAMPVAQAAFIASKMCEGLHYAHTRKDARGQELGIIHRDVSPQNILVSYEGEVKIIDFGIAKAANRSQKTQAGILKGKFGYMSPEMVRGQPIDRRSDIFALGIILFELLTGEKLFTGESDYSVLEKVRNAQVPEPRALNPDIPPALERVLRKALAREPADRYQWASELQEDLVRFLLIGEQIFTSRHLSEFMKSAFAEEIERENGEMEQYATVERPAEMDGAGRHGTPAPELPAAFGVADDEEAGADKTQLIDPGAMGLPLYPDEAGGGEDNPEATRFDAVNPFGHEVEEPERGGRVVIGAGEAYVGETVIGAVPSRPEMAAVGADATRLAPGRTQRVDAYSEEDAGDRTYTGGPLGQTASGAAGLSEEDDLTGETDAPEYDEQAGDDAAEYDDEAGDDASGYDEEAGGDASEDSFATDGGGRRSEEGDEITGSVSTPGHEGQLSPRPSPLAPLLAWRWFPHAAVGAAAVLVLLLVLLALGLRGPKGQPLVVRALGADAVQITVDGQPVKNGVVTLVPPGAHEIAVSAKGYLTEHRSLSVVAGQVPPVVEVPMRSDRPPPPPVTPPTPPATPTPPVATNDGQTAPATPPEAGATPEHAPSSPLPKTFNARFDAAEAGIEVSVEGDEAGTTPDAELSKLIVGKTYHFTAKRAGYKTRSGTFSSPDGSDVLIPVDLDKAPAPVASHEPRHVHHAAAPPVTRPSRSRVMGRLAASTHPAGAEIYVDNRATGRHTPVAPGSPLLIPVGPHQISFRLGSKRSPVQKVVIDENETTKLINVPLE